MRALFLAVLLAGCATSARADDAMAPFAPLIGCWHGAFEGNAEIRDDRCFEPMLGGRYVRDTHAVQPTSYRGETIYFTDVARSALAFTYYSSDGGMSAGVWHAEEGALVFEPHTYVGADGATLRMRSRWTIESADRFVTTSEVERDGAWQPWGRITYTRANAP
ncbi:MAG: DUF1579 family protein [Hyphomonadaceae bacterium]|nr:DUF1579 family protein [Hyphomonadaceae bacterium]